MPAIPSALPFGFIGYLRISYQSLSEIRDAIRNSLFGPLVVVVDVSHCDAIAFSNGSQHVLGLVGEPALGVRHPDTHHRVVHLLQHNRIRFLLYFHGNEATFVSLRLVVRQLCLLFT